MPRLKDRNKQVPGGLQFRQPEISWDSTKALGSMPSLRVLAEAVQRVRHANPHLAKVHGWRMALEDIEYEVDAVNAQRCLDHGWTNFVTMDDGGLPAPKAPALQPTNRASQLVAGLKTIADMMGPGGAVAHETANRRAAVCVTCPKNSKGDWTRFFTVPASEQIRRLITDRDGAGLKTDHDEQLQICEVCSCPLELKVHAQLAHIKKHMDKAVEQGLWENCWIRTEV